MTYRRPASGSARQTIHGALGRSGHERGVVLHAVLFVVVSVLAGVLVSGMLIPFAGMLGLSAKSATDSFDRMPSKLEEPDPPMVSVMFDADRNPIARFYDENRDAELNLDQVAKVMQEAVLAIEDDRFYDHGPLDVKGAARAFGRNAGSGTSQGGSTITQQYVKQVLFTHAETAAERKKALEVSYGRKLQELRYAVELEKTRSKDRIFADYLNIVYYGNGAYGIASAAQRYFSVKANQLTLPQAALLAGMVRNPNLSPTRDKEQMKDRRDFVLRRMAETKRITVADAKKAMAQPLEFKWTSAKAGCLPLAEPGQVGAHFCDYAREWLLDDKNLGKTRQERNRKLLEGGLRIYTTLDTKIQRETEKAIRKKVYAKDPVAAAVTLVQPGTGHIKAMAQSKLYGKGKGRTFLNYNTGQSDNGGLGVQPGSTFKPFVLAAALEQGVPLNHRVRSPSRVRYQDMKKCNGKMHKVQTPSFVSNSTKPRGSILSLAEGTARSVNTFYVNLEAETGLCGPYKMATKTGVQRGDGKDLEQVPSFVLGVNNVTPLSMSEAYATFAARGIHCDAIPVAEVRDRHGGLVKTRGAQCKRVMKQEVADATNDVLKKVVDSNIAGRTARDMSLKRDLDVEAAGKTGTNNMRMYVSFVGYTTKLAGFAVVGDDHPTLRSLMGQEIGGKRVGEDEVWGGKLAGPIWKGAMEGAIKAMKEKPADFVPPDPNKVKGVTLPVPDVKGKHQSEAMRILASSKGKFQGIVGGSENSNLPQGTVIRQFPGPGGETTLNGQVTLWVSNGIPPAPKPPEDPCIKNPNLPQCQQVPPDPACAKPNPPPWCEFIGPRRIGPGTREGYDSESSDVNARYDPRVSLY